MRTKANSNRKMENPMSYATAVAVAKNATQVPASPGSEVHEHTTDSGEGQVPEPQPPSPTEEKKMRVAEEQKEREHTEKLMVECREIVDSMPDERKAALQKYHEELSMKPLRDSEAKFVESQTKMKEVTKAFADGLVAVEEEAADRKVTIHVEREKLKKQLQALDQQEKELAAEDLKRKEGLKETVTKAAQKMKEAETAWEKEKRIRLGQPVEQEADKTASPSTDGSMKARVSPMTFAQAAMKEIDIIYKPKKKPQLVSVKSMAPAPITNANTVNSVGKGVREL